MPSGAHPTPTRLRRFARWLGWFLGAAILAGAGLIFFAPALLWVQEPCPHADAIVVLGGGSSERPLQAARLFHAGAAPVILLTGTGDWPLNQSILRTAGVPAEAILVDPNARTTWENARNTVAMMHSQGFHDAILVTTWYHSRRAENCFRHVAPDLKFYSQPSTFGVARSEWWHDGLLRYIVMEYPKTLWYGCRYGVPPMTGGSPGRPGVTP